jgi:hypothetical protein
MNSVIDLADRMHPTLEAFCNANFMSRCPRAMKGDEFLTAEVQGNRIWLHPPKGLERTAIEHYLTCKQKDPTKTSAYIIVPQSQTQNANQSWTPLLKGMVLLKQYTKDDKIFTPIKNPDRRFGFERCKMV